MGAREGGRALPQQFATPLGNITITEELVASVAGLLARQFDGVAGMVPRRRIVGRESPTRGVRVELEDGRANVFLRVRLEDGVRLADLGDALVEWVRRGVEDATGIPVRKVRVTAYGAPKEA
ncbi:MAG: Asp23/Gls24 family envelope stress response protein [Thermaerobacter sp.]|jgi:uncharacterized alkaline shock family protein YloU|nr:Asp23/Gls24 family envelope stress response protein [Thermaerobacter sp.]